MHTYNILIPFYRMNHISSIADSAFANLIKLQSIELTYCNLTKGSFTHDAFRGDLAMNETI